MSFFSEFPGERTQLSEKATQPTGLRFFSSQTSLLTPHRRLKGMASFASRLGQKSLAANVVVFMKWGNKGMRILERTMGPTS